MVPNPPLHIPETPRYQARQSPRVAPGAGRFRHQSNRVKRVKMATKARSAEGSSSTASTTGGEGVRRRDFLNVQMSPPADVLALASTEVDLSKILPGQGIKVSWRKQPVFVRNLTPKEIAAAEAVPLSDLRDPQSLAERTKPG